MATMATMVTHHLFGSRSSEVGGGGGGVGVTFYIREYGDVRAL